MPKDQFGSLTAILCTTKLSLFDQFFTSFMMLYKDSNLGCMYELPTSIDKVAIYSLIFGQNLDENRMIVATVLFSNAKPTIARHRQLEV